MNYHDRQHRLWILNELKKLVNNAVEEIEDDTRLLQMYEEIEKIISEMQAVVV